MFWFQNNKGKKILAAIRSGDARVLQKVLAGAPGDARATGPDGEPVLFAAVLSGRREMVRALLRAGADPNTHNRTGETALLRALTPRTEAVAQLLLNRGADPNKADRYGMTPLHIAAFRGHLRLVEMLLRAGADANRVDQDGVSPLTAAVTGGHAHVVRALLRHGVPVSANGNTIEDLRQMAHNHGHRAVLEVLDEFAPRSAKLSEQGESTVAEEAAPGDSCQVYRGTEAAPPDFIAGVAPSDIPATCLKHVRCEYTPHIETQRIYAAAGRDQNGDLPIAFEGIAVSCGATSQYGHAVAMEQGVMKPYRYADLNHIFACCCGNPELCPFYATAKTREAELDAARQKVAMVDASPEIDIQT